MDKSSSTPLEYLFSIAERQMGSKLEKQYFWWFLSLYFFIYRFIGPVRYKWLNGKVTSKRNVPDLNIYYLTYVFIIAFGILKKW